MSFALIAPQLHAQNYERYAPKNLNDPRNVAPQRPEIKHDDLPDVNADDRVLVERLEAVRIIDAEGKLLTDASIDGLEGVHIDVDAYDSLLYSNAMRQLIQRRIGQPITLRNLNLLARDIITRYRKCKQPIVDVQIPEQRITGGTVQLIVIESRIDSVRIVPGCYFSCRELSPWIARTRPGDRVYEPNIESDLLWLNQNQFRRVTVDFEKGARPGTTNVLYNVSDVRPIRGYIGADDTGVPSLNYGRYFAGFTMGNVYRGGILGYQYTADSDFSLLEAHSLNYTQPLSRRWSWQSYGSWAGVSPMIGGGLSQEGESWQLGGSLVRHLHRSQSLTRDLTLGFDFKSTNNNLEFAGTTIADSNADLFQLRLGFSQILRGAQLDDYSWLQVNGFVGPGGGLTGAHSSTAFQSIRPGTTPSYVYGRLQLEQSRVFCDRWQLVNRASVQAASDRLLFSEMLGFGGFDTLRGFDQRAYNADHGWLANLELGPRTIRWGSEHSPQSLRVYGFTDLAYGYMDSPLPGEDGETFGLSTGAGLRYRVADRLIARVDYGVGLVDLENAASTNRIHFGATWIPGRSP